MSIGVMPQNSAGAYPTAVVLRELANERDALTSGDAKQVQMSAATVIAQLDKLSVSPQYIAVLKSDALNPTRLNLEADIAFLVDVNNPESVLSRQPAGNSAPNLSSSGYTAQSYGNASSPYGAPVPPTLSNASLSGQYPDSSTATYGSVTGSPYSSASNLNNGNGSTSYTGSPSYASSSAPSGYGGAYTPAYQPQIAAAA